MMLRLAPRAPGAAPLRILALGAHADDIEIGCGGAVLRLLAEHPGAEVRYVVFSASPVRADEARRAAAELAAGAARLTVDIHDFRDSSFPWDRPVELKQAVADLARAPSRMSCSPTTAPTCTRITRSSPSCRGTHFAIT